jgi:hypothetical protein
MPIRVVSTKEAQGREGMRHCIRVVSIAAFDVGPICSTIWSARLPEILIQCKASYIKTYLHQ